MERHGVEIGVKGKGLSDSSIHLSDMAFASLLSPSQPPPKLPVPPAALSGVAQGFVSSNQKGQACRHW